MALTNISWAATAVPTSSSPIQGYTFNPWQGCTRVGPGCDNCYAEACSSARFGRESWDENSRHFNPDKYWKAPLTWNRRAIREGTRLRVFCASMGDVFEKVPPKHPSFGTMERARERLWDLIEKTTSLDWLLLTKRPQNIKRMLPNSLQGAQHVWLGFTGEIQRLLDQRFKLLPPFAVDHPLFISVEPQLERIDLPQGLAQWGSRCMVICGGESGGKARPFDPAWATDLQAQCRSMGLRFHMKQFGSRPVGMKLKHPHGSRMSEWPSSIRVREWCAGIPINQP